MSPEGGGRRGMSANCKGLITFFFFLAELIKEEKLVLGNKSAGWLEAAGKNGRGACEERCSILAASEDLI